MLAPAPGALVLLGIWMVVDSDAWDFGQLWIGLALALFAAAFVFGVGPEPGRARRRAGCTGMDLVVRPGL